MKKAYKNLMAYAMWALLVGLVIATGPTIGFGQDANDLVSQIMDEAMDAPAEEVANEPEANDVSDEMAEEVADEPMDEPADDVANQPAIEPASEQTSEPARRPMGRSANEVAAQPANEVPNEAPREDFANRSMNRRGNRRGDEEVSESGVARAEYSIITQRNMFSQNRTPPRPDREPIVNIRPPDPNEESYYILRGIVRENNTFIAFLQDDRQGGVLQLHAGDKVARGTIKSLTLDSLEYEHGDKTTAVAFGHDLEGRVAASSGTDSSQLFSTSYAPATDYTLPSSARRSRDTSGRGNGNNGRFGGDRITSTRSTPATTEEPLSDDAAAVLLQRMIERRQQQLGQ